MDLSVLCTEKTISQSQNANQLSHQTCNFFPTRIFQRRKKSVDLLHGSKFLISLKMVTLSSIVLGNSRCFHMCYFATYIR